MFAGEVFSLQNISNKGVIAKIRSYGAKRAKPRVSGAFFASGSILLGGIKLTGMFLVGCK